MAEDSSAAVKSARGWVNWKRGFAELPVSLTKGSNGEINGFLHSNGIEDLIPLRWKDQFCFRAAVERKLGESFAVSGGYAHQNSPVPSSTLSPLTAAIMQNAFSAGFRHRRGRARFDVAYQLNLSAEQRVGMSSLRSGEFDNSRVRVGTQGLILSTAWQL